MAHPVRAECILHGCGFTWPACRATGAHRAYAVPLACTHAAQIQQPMYTQHQNVLDPTNFNRNRIFTARKDFYTSYEIVFFLFSVYVFSYIYLYISNDSNRFLPLKKCTRDFFIIFLGQWNMWLEKKKKISNLYTIPFCSWLISDYSCSILCLTLLGVIDFSSQVKIK